MSILPVPISGFLPIPKITVSIYGVLLAVMVPLGWTCLGQVGPPLIAWSHLAQWAGWTGAQHALENVHQWFTAPNRSDGIKYSAAAVLILGTLKSADYRLYRDLSMNADANYGPIIGWAGVGVLFEIGQPIAAGIAVAIAMLIVGVYSYRTKDYHHLAGCCSLLFLLVLAPLSVWSLLDRKTTPKHQIIRLNPDDIAKGIRRANQEH